MKKIQTKDFIIFLIGALKQLKLNERVLKVIPARRPDNRISRMPPRLETSECAVCVLIKKVVYTVKRCAVHISSRISENFTARTIESLGRSTVFEREV